MATCPYPRLKFERQRRGWSQAQVGALVAHFGLHRALTQFEVSQIERGRLNPTHDELHALARVLQVDPAEALLLQVDPMLASQVESSAAEVAP